MITVNKLPLMKRSRLKAVMNYNPSNKKYGSLVILNTLNTNDLLNKFKPIDISYQNLLIYTYAKRRDYVTKAFDRAFTKCLSARDCYIFWFFEFEWIEYFTYDSKDRVAF